MLPFEGRVPVGAFRPCFACVASGAGVPSVVALVGNLAGCRSPRWPSERVEGDPGGRVGPTVPGPRGTATRRVNPWLASSAGGPAPG